MSMYWDENLESNREVLAEQGFEVFSDCCGRWGVIDPFGATLFTTELDELHAIEWGARFARIWKLGAPPQGDECLCVGSIRGTLNTALECPHHAPGSNQEGA